MQLLLPILGGLFLGVWLTHNFGLSPIWTVILAILGMIGGLGVMYKRVMYAAKSNPVPPPIPKFKSTRSKHSASKSQTPSSSEAPPKTIRDLDFMYNDPDDEPDEDDDR